MARRYKNALPTSSWLCLTKRNQRVDAYKNTKLPTILAHNRDEEKEHATMLLEWIRRRNYLFSDKVIDHWCGRV